jgi:triosephosphate isomerase
MRKPIIAGNWKMNMSIASGVEFINNIKDEVAGTDVEVLICAPFTLLKDLKKATVGTNVNIGAQNMHFEKSGAFTGEVSAQMLKEIGVDYVVIGHSERRQYFAESDETVNKKVIVALENGITPVMCCGETLEERESGSTKEIVNGQIEKGLANIDGANISKIVIAYEPIWAIGTGKTSSAAEANEVIAYIRSVIEAMHSDEVSEEVRIQYGGSVKPANVEEIMNQTDIDGALVGGASLEADSFVALVNF